MRVLEANEVNAVSGGFNPWTAFVTGVFIYNAVTSWAEGVQDGYDEAASSAE